MPTILKDRLELLDALNLRNKCCAEIGVLHGDFSAEILKREPFDLYLVDPWLKNQEQDWNQQIRQQNDFDELHARVVERFKDNHHAHVMKMTSHQAAREINRQFDFVFIDGSHTLANAYHDLCAWSVKMKPGGWLCGHDYKSAFIGVEQSVDMFLDVTGHELVYETSEEWASFGIRIK